MVSDEARLCASYTVPMNFKRNWAKLRERKIISVSVNGTQTRKNCHRSSLACA